MSMFQRSPNRLDVAANLTIPGASRSRPLWVQNWMVALVAIAWGVLAVTAPAAPALRVLSTAKTGTPILVNGGFEEGEGALPPPVAALG